MTTLHVVNHVHWDREWYRPMEAFRARLVELVAQVCDALDDKRLPSFHLDGQTVTVTDVEAVDPALAQRVREHARAGRLSIGPWHVLADNQLVSGENLIRNLLTARRVAGGAGLATVGYCPDSFGHPADLPRILRGFGLDTALVWRGAPPEHARFRWRSPDGSEVYAVNQCYYEPDVLWNEDGLADRVAAYAAKQRDRAGDGPQLLLNGADHLAPALDRQDPALTHSTLAQFFADPGHDRDSAPVIEGELRHPGGWLTFLLPGTLSSRMYLKQANAAVQTLLESWVEPYLAQTDATGSTTGMLRHAWELLLANSPHDSICGCSVDEVHRENEVRFERATQVGEHLLARSLQRMGLDTRLYGEPSADSLSVLVANPHPRPVRGPVELDVYSAPGRHVLGLRDADGADVPFEVSEPEQTPLFCADLDLPPDTRPAARHRLLFVAEVGPSGRRGYQVLLGDAPAAQAEPLTHPWQVEIAQDASLTLTDTRTGRVLPGLARLVDGGDAGDTYNYDPPRDDEQISPRVTAVRAQATPVRRVWHVDAVLDLPRGLSADRSARAVPREPVAVTVTATLWRGVERLDWTVAFDNTVGDHRLRAHFPTGPAQDWAADTHFSVLHRPLSAPLGPLPTERAYEADCAVAPVHGWAAAGGLGLLTAGLPEVQGLLPAAAPELAVTVLRATGWLSRPDLRSRTTGAGPQLPTPQAQCLRQVTAAIGVVLDTGELEMANAAGLHRAPLRAWQLRFGSPVPSPVDGIAVSGAVVTAVKPAEDGDGFVLRVANPTGLAMTAVVGGLDGRVAGECSLAEEPVTGDPDPGALALGPYQVRSLRVR
ncbi:glycoside hydrolase [Catellatospora sp. IY07-71]|uniref:glycoside hydrolase family 38 N-terminal domain-containing protein n=1 Tax=Catellatospora sp. IY07-71 TaxID=2728827 RepID=UPI001BB31E2F|nr:glycosyl hydrolase-related protein [Catellatospora sp. IY07-71]BCJ75795.1 glycoside hydrolase [Catellatospora sp. IY07-71]